VQDEKHLDTLADRVTEVIGEGNKLDGVVHSIGYMAQSGMGINRSSTRRTKTSPRHPHLGVLVRLAGQGAAGRS